MEKKLQQFKKDLQTFIKDSEEEEKEKHLNEYEHVRDAGEDLLTLLQLEMEEKRGQEVCEEKEKEMERHFELEKMKFETEV